MNRRAPYTPAPHTTLAEAMRQFRELHQWHNRLLLDPSAKPDAIAEVAALCGQAEKKVLRLETMREVR